MSTATRTAIPERRRFLRTEVPRQIGINLLEPQNTSTTGSLNLSEGGVCLRLEEELEVKALVRMQLSPDGRARSGLLKNQPPVHCTGRVAWVIQRLDLRATPPFLYDVGIEFVDPPLLLRQLMTRASPLPAKPKERAAREKTLEPAVIRGRRYQAVMGRQSSAPARWHLVVSIDGVPCFSGHYPSERQALDAWTRFKRNLARAPK